MSGFKLCRGCDALRNSDREHCASCGEQTDSYLHHPSEREEFELLALASRPVSFTQLVPHSPYGFAVKDAA